MSPSPMKALNAQGERQGHEDDREAAQKGGLCAAAEAFPGPGGVADGRGGRPGLLRSVLKARVRRVFVEIEGLVPAGIGGVIVHARLRYEWSFPVYLNRCEEGMGSECVGAHVPPRLDSQA